MNVDQTLGRRRFLRVIGGLSLSPFVSSLDVLADGAALFGRGERRSDDLSAFTKWKGMWMRHEEGVLLSSGIPDPAEPGALEQDDPVQGAGVDDLKKMLDGLEGKPVADQIKAVNRFVNRRRYIIDPWNWNVPDYWATPKEFFRKDGDCEDYAITKYVVLKGLGHDVSTMRIVVVQDENLGVGHAVLGVWSKGDILILDNQFDDALSHTKIHHYRPVYSINESAWWLHKNI